MAIIVPRPTERIAPTPVVTPERTTPEDFGAGAGRNIQQLGSEVGQLAQIQQDKMNVAAVQEATSKLYDFQTNALYGKDGLYSVKGADAMGKSDQIMKDFQTNVDTISANLKNDKQRQGFQNQVMQMKRSIESRSSQYEFQQNQEYQHNQHVAIIGQAENAAITGYNTPGEIQNNLNTIDQTIMLDGDLNGLPPAEINLRIKQARSKVHSNIISKMITDGNYQQADAYFKANKSDFVADDLARTKQALKTGGVRQRAQTQTDAIMAKGLSESDALTQARKISDPNVRDSVVSRIGIRYREQAQIAKQQQLQNYQSVADEIEKGISTDNIDPNQWLALTPAQRTNLVAREKSIRTGTQPATNWKTYTKLSTMSPQELLNTNLYDYRNQLSDAKYSELINEQRAIRNKQSNNQNLHSSTLSFNQMVQNHAKQIGMVPYDETPSQWSDTQAKNYVQFQEAAQQKINDFEEVNNRKATPQERQNIINETALSAVEIASGSWYSSDKEVYPFQVQQDQRGNVYVDYDKIKPADLTSIKNLLRSNNKPLSKDLIQQIAGAYAMGDRQRVLQLAGAQ